MMPAVENEECVVVDENKQNGQENREGEQNGEIEEVKAPEEPEASEAEQAEGVDVQQCFPPVKENLSVVAAMSARVMVGDLVSKPFSGHGVFEGQVISTKVGEPDDLDPRDWFTIEYEDGDVEVRRPF
jgi:hypothetical protein